MAFLRRLFRGPKKKYPPLPAGDHAARYLQRSKRTFESLVKRISEPVEAVPSYRRTYVFIGAPPRRFVFGWLEGGKAHSFREQAAARGVSPKRLDALIEELRSVYQENESLPRYRASVAGREIVVTPSRQMELELEEVITKALG